MRVKTNKTAVFLRTLARGGGSGWQLRRGLTVTVTYKGGYECRCRFCLSSVHSLKYAIHIPSGLYMEDISMCQKCIGCSFQTLILQKSISPLAVFKGSRWLKVWQLWRRAGVKRSEERAGTLRTEGDEQGLSDKGRKSKGHSEGNEQGMLRQRGMSKGLSEQMADEQLILIRKWHFKVILIYYYMNSDVIK